MMSSGDLVSGTVTSTHRYQGPDITKGILVGAELDRQSSFHLKAILPIRL